MSTAPRIRPGTMADNQACASVLAEAVNDLGLRSGSIDPDSTLQIDEQWPRWRSFFDHLTRTGAEFWVAEGDDEMQLGYARSIDRDGLFELTEFFVRPWVQSGGLGRDLLDRAFPAGRGDLRLVIVTTDVRALSRYFRSGVAARFPVLSFTGQSRDVAASDGLEVEPLDLDRDMPAIHVDEAVLGHRREVDHRWFATEREGHRYLRDGRMAGYGYVGLPGTGATGRSPSPTRPTCRRSSHTPSVGDTSWARPRRCSRWRCTTRSRSATSSTAATGMDPFMTLLCSSEPFGRFDRYLFCGPALML